MVSLIQDIGGFLMSQYLKYKVFKWGRTIKEAGLVWCSWHKGLTVNDWRAQHNPNADRNCPVCDSGARETVLHRFAECPSTQRVWHWFTHILNLLTATDPLDMGPWRQFHWKQTIFSTRIPRKFKELGFIWAAMRGVVFWTLWISRNDRVFNGIAWTEEKLYQKVWLGLIDYGRVAWQKLQARSRQQPRGCRAASGNLHTAVVSKQHLCYIFTRRKQGAMGTRRTHCCLPSSLQANSYVLMSCQLDMSVESCLAQVLRRFCPGRSRLGATPVYFLLCN